MALDRKTNETLVETTEPKNYVDIPISDDDLWAMSMTHGEHNLLPFLNWSHEECIEYFNSQMRKRGIDPSRIILSFYDHDKDIRIYRVETNEPRKETT